MVSYSQSNLSSIHYSIPKQSTNNKSTDNEGTDNKSTNHKYTDNEGTDNQGTNVCYAQLSSTIRHFLAYVVSEQPTNDQGTERFSVNLTN
mmetsp:Transcript_59114/g.94100  ORF Transcript_59114/g.94100 Transcript_59114/m.94100 type:complete len:90 (+) Transcript_59114:141-410(+)